MGEEALEVSTSGSGVPATAGDDVEGGRPVEVSGRRQVRGSSLLLLGRLMSLGLNTLTQVVIVRALTKTEYGAFAYALSFVSLGESVIGLGLDRGASRFLALYDETGDRRRSAGVLVMTFGVVGGLGLALLLLTYGLQSWLSGSVIDDARSASLLLILILLSPLNAWDSAFNSLFAVFSEAKAIFVRKYVIAPSFRLAVVVLLALGDRGVTFLAAGYVFGGALGIAYYGWLSRRLLRERGVWSHLRPGGFDVPWREVLAFCVPLLTVDLVYVAMNTVDALLVGAFHGATAVAAMRAVLPVAKLNMLVMQSFNSLFLPAASRLYARQDHEGVNDLYWQTATWIAVISFPVFALSFCLAEPLAVTLFGGEYRDAGTLLAFLSVGYYFQAALGFNGVTLRAYGRVRAVLVVNLAAAGISLALNLALIPPYGARGAVVGSMISLIAFNLMKQAAMVRVASVEPFPRRYARIYASIVAAAAGLALFAAVVELPFVALLGVAALVSLVVLWANRAALEVAATFPEVRRIPVLGRLLVR
jgi:O-antigen/teichoic acid export membrane protein